MKKSLIFLLITISILLVTVSVSAQNASYSASYDIETVVNNKVEQIKINFLDAVLSTISVFLLFVVAQIKAYFAQATKEKQHKRGSSVVEDSLFSAIFEADSTLEKVLASKAERVRVSVIWASIAKTRLKELAGFKKADLNNWISTQQTIILSKKAQGV